MNAGQMMTWEDFKLKFSKYHVPQGLIKKMRDEFRELKQGRMSVVEYRGFLTLSRYAPDETDTNEKRKERFLNGLHDEMQTVLVNIPFADLEALVDSAIQMEGKLHQANENRKRRMMNRMDPTIPDTACARPSLTLARWKPERTRPVHATVSTHAVSAPHDARTRLHAFAWTRSTSSPSLTGKHDHHYPSYLLDTLPSSRTLPDRRHDRRMPRRYRTDAIIASSPQTPFPVPSLISSA
ncbi:hypothetical protein QYE76_023683 [Lolium multiflorum]|uniref:Retrotransposon gag domain-containing protein n=1 Tax=Lolium multiflorum TaxID=4521 RepID=A0AAD8RC85_LOLMU|nr:hypothetical protein QYE76_023683 [Lolium multiflorum]